MFIGCPTSRATQSFSAVFALASCGLRLQRVKRSRKAWVPENLFQPVDLKASQRERIRESAGVAGLHVTAVEEDEHLAFVRVEISK